MYDMYMFDLRKILGFEWDEGNINKNEKKHKVSWKECEEIFNNKPLVILPDFLHSNVEKRFEALGRTNDNKQLVIIFTLRANFIRIISARLQNKKERKKFQSITILSRQL